MKRATTGPRLALFEHEVSRPARAVLSEKGETADLFGLPVVRVFPPPSDSCDACAVVEAVDRHRYLVKTAETWPALPLSELICHEVFRLCGLQLLPWRQIAMPDGTLAFGSRWLPDTFELGGVLNTPLQLIRRLESTAVLSAILFLDLFFQNQDRHWNNLLFVPIPDSDRVHIVPIDFSRAFLYHAFPPPDVASMPTSCHTLATGRTVFRTVGLNLAAIDKVSKRLQAVTAKQIQAVIHPAPSEWKHGLNIEYLLDWWDSSQRDSRIRTTKEVISHGAILRVRNS